MFSSTSSTMLMQCFYLLLLLSFVSSNSNHGSPILLRIRNADGSMTRIAIPHDDQDSTPLSSILSSALSNSDDDDDDNGDDNGDDIKCQIGSNRNVDMSQSITSLGLKHGSLISIIPPPRPANTPSLDNSSATASSTKSTIARYTTFDPYPSLAKSTSFNSAARRQRALARLPSKRGMSYTEISKLQSNMHTIEPQSNGPIKRIYMCLVGAQRFKDSCTVTVTKKQKNDKKKVVKETQIQNKCALLLGSIHKERVDQSKQVARTSLSTPLQDMKMCEVVKVHAVWEPPQQQSSTNDEYDGNAALWKQLQDSDDNDKMKKKKKKGNLQLDRVLKLADMLGLQPVGWIYSYSDDRLSDSSSSIQNSDEDSLPVGGRDVILGAMAQIQNMERNGSDNGCKFLTLALDATTGATEAFQLSDVSVQMVAEGVLSLSSTEGDDDGGFGRLIKTQDPIVIDTKETTELDSVLCLINTAMLSHEGYYSGKEHVNAVKKGGNALTMKTKKNLLAKLDFNGGGEEDGQLLKELCDFNILLVLQRLIGKDDMSELCRLIRKYTRGQKKGTVIDQKLKLVLKSILEV